MTTLQIRPDIREQYAQLFGPKTVNGRTLVVEDVIERLVQAIDGELQELLAARHAVPGTGCAERRAVRLPASRRQRSATPTAIPPTVEAIRRGMLDGFFGRATPDAWRLNPTVPIPADTMRPGLEGTGPAIDLGMAMARSTAARRQWMWDWEDAGGDYKDQLYRAWQNLGDILAHEWDGKPYEHPTKKRTYRIDGPSEKWPTIFHRVPGLHLRNRQISVGRRAGAGDRFPPSSSTRSTTSTSQQRNGSGIYYYIPKIETWQEARLVGDAAEGARRGDGRPRGTLKIKMLNERAEYALQQEVIMWVLRENLIGPNVGRWDYINSREEMFRHDPAMVIPNPHTITMTESSMIYYTMRNALLALLAGGMPIGGHGGADAEPARARARRQGAARHLVRQAARAADRPLPDQRHAARHLSTELGRHRRARLRRGRPRAARHRRR